MTSTMCYHEMRDGAGGQIVPSLAQSPYPGRIIIIQYIGKEDPK